MSELVIKAPTIERVRNTTTLGYETTVGKLIFEIQSPWEVVGLDYRCDPALVALLPWALRGAGKVICHGEVSDELLWSLRELVIPSLGELFFDYHSLTIEAGIATEDRRGTKRALAMTAGVDSLFTLRRMMDAGRVPDAFVVCSNGCVEEKDNHGALMGMAARVRGLADAVGVGEVVSVESNIQELVSEHYAVVSLFRMAASALSLGASVGEFVLASSYSIARGIEADPYDIATLAPVLWPQLGCGQTEFKLHGEAYSRMAKLRELSEWDVAWHFLHPCADPVATRNCGRCPKCKGAQMGLFALGALERFDAVFDVESFKRHFPRHMAEAVSARQWPFGAEVLALLAEQGIEPTLGEKLAGEALRKARGLKWRAAGAGKAYGLFER